MNPVDFREQIFFSTIRIEFPNKRTMGTGFLVRVPSKDNLSYIFLVSNRHVINDIKEELHIVFHEKDIGSDLPILFANHKFAINKIEKAAYYSHPSQEIDLACLNISELFTAIPGKSFYIRTIGLEIISDFTESDLLPGNDVIFVGYPEDRYDHANNLPILRGGRIASLPKVNFENQPQFLIDAPVFQGSSGSPLFTIIGSAYKLIGVVSATMIKNQQLEVVELNPNIIVPQTIGIGLAYKSTCVKELIMHATGELNSFRK